MNDLPLQFGDNEVIPRMIPLKFPPKMGKAEKIKGLDWRFRHFRLKLPLDRASTGPYRALWYQVENFTPDLGLLQHDDVIDTLAMHQAIGKPRASVGPDIIKPPDPLDLLRNGQFAYDSGVPVLSGVNINKIPEDVLEAMSDLHREAVEESDDELVEWIPGAYYA
jgi:hypothetical protein